MALLDCWECKGKISSAASSCPHCGAPITPPQGPAYLDHVRTSHTPQPESVSELEPSVVHTHTAGSAETKQEVKKESYTRTCSFCGASMKLSRNTIRSVVYLIFGFGALLISSPFVWAIWQVWRESKQGINWVAASPYLAVPVLSLLLMGLALRHSQYRWACGGCGKQEFR